jgi:hypothetical protein
VALPLLLSIFATVSAAVVAYGTHPAWAQFRHGLAFILLSRRLQWPLVTLCLLLCLTLLGLIIGGKRRAWWLIALGPVLALFVHRFATDPTGQMFPLDNPSFASADAASFLRDEDYVVGLSFEGQAYAYPYGHLYANPVVVQAEHDKRMMLMWSAYANRAVATYITRDVRARDFDVVSVPANALLLYDTRVGTFVNGVTGLTTAGKKPRGFLSPIETRKMPWGRWRALHPESKVLEPGWATDRMPNVPLLPSRPMPKVADGWPADMAIVLVGAGASPAAVASEALGPAPVNLRADGVPAFVFRDPASGSPRAFDRRLDDLAPRFELNQSAGRKGAFLDVDTDSGWDVNGAAVDPRAETKGKRLARVPVEDGLYWGVMKHWYPDLELPAAATTRPAAKDVPQTQPGTRTETPAEPAKPRGERRPKPSAPVHPPKTRPRG